jgi:hypothetical protein
LIPPILYQPVVKGIKHPLLGQLTENKGFVFPQQFEVCNKFVLALPRTFDLRLLNIALFMPAGCPGSKDSNTVRPIVRDRSVLVFEFHWNKSESTTGVSLKNK